MTSKSDYRPAHHGDPGLARFDPLERIISLDDFDRGFCGWSQLVGNYERSLDTMLPGYAQHSSPMLSTLPHWDAGSHGGLDGDYALKISTRPKAGAQNATIKRLTFRTPGKIRVEAYFTFKPQASELRLSETDVRSIGLLLDVQSGDRTAEGRRVMPHFRFLNAEGGEHVQRWQFKPRGPSFVAVGKTNETLSHYHLDPSGWVNLHDGDQRLCYNEIPTKVNWSYLCMDFDLSTMEATALRCNDREISLEGFESISMPAMRNLWCMLNVVFFVETDVAKRAFLYLDSVCISGEQ